MTKEPERWEKTDEKSKGKLLKVDFNKANGVRVKRGCMAVSVVAAVLLIGLYVMIFFFSGQEGEDSGSLSHQVTEIIVEQVEKITNQHWSEKIRESIISYWEHPVRKLAHFSEYAIMGILVFLTLFPQVLWDRWKKNAFRWNALVIAWVFVSAALDEWHQTFIKDRCGNFWDVLLDTSGGCVGLLLCILTVKIIFSLKNKKSR